MPMLKVKGIDVSYKDLQVLLDVSFEVNQGELVVILGANGAGKTTLLKAISGILHLDKGSIEFEGKEISKMPGHKVAELGIVHVPEGRRLFPEMSVLETGDGLPLVKRKKTQKDPPEVFNSFLSWKKNKNRRPGL